MIKEPLKILVISDLHAEVGKGESDDTRLVFDQGESPFGEDFIEYARSLNKEVDLLICAGDISNKADPDSFRSGWKFIKKIKEKINATELVCVPGNHDHQSRSERVFDPKHYMQFIEPSFPFDSSEYNTQFWAWHWCHFVPPSKDYNIILVNTSAYHGYKDEHHHGRVSPEACEQIERHLNSDNFKAKPINILVCHHHPVKMEHIEHNSDTESIDGGDRLMSMLDSVDKGSWVVIHGHRHYADICHGRTYTGMKTVVFSAGSMSARLYPEIEKKTSNQFYYISIDLNKSEEIGSAAGTVEAHEWNFGVGWRPSLSSQLPHKFGFGTDSNINVLARKIGKKALHERFLNKEDLEEFQSDFTALMPKQFSMLVNKLSEQGFIVGIEENRLVEVAKQ